MPTRYDPRLDIVLLIQVGDLIQDVQAYLWIAQAW